MSPITFLCVRGDTDEDKADAEYWARRARTAPNCIQCGRFCRIVSDVVEYNGSINQNYVTFDCKHCGTFTESMW